MPLTTKLYYCPTCGHEQHICTNHYGETYSGCKNCYNDVMYCRENEVNWEATKHVKCRLKYYRFTINDEKYYPGQTEQYNELRKALKACGYKKFDTWGPMAARGYTMYTSKAIKAYADHDNTDIILTLESNIGGDQWVSNIGRVHNWYEVIYPNKNVKEGYYLEMNDDLAEAIKDPKYYTK